MPEPYKMKEVANDTVSSETPSEAKEDAPLPSTPSSQDITYLTGPKLFLVISGITLACFLMLLDTAVIATATPKITSDFHSLDDIGWYGTAYFLSNCAVQPLSGKLYTHFNVKHIFLSFFAIFEIGSALCGAAVSSDMLIVGRVVAGLGASGLLNGGLTITHFIVEPERRDAYRGILMGISILGILAGPLVGGALTTHTTWRWCFYINLPCGVVIAAFIMAVAIPDYGIAKGKSQSLTQTLQKLDLIGFLLFCPAVVMFILALQWGGHKFLWGSATIIGLFCGAFVNLLVFLVWEHRMGAEAMVPLHLLQRRIIWSSCLFMTFFIGCNFITSYYMPIYFQAVRGASPVQSGVDMLPQVLTNFILTILTGALVGRLGYYLPFAIASGVFISVGTGLLSTLTPTSSNSSRIGYQILQGFMGLGFQIPIMAVQNGVSSELVPIASALLVFSQNLSAATFLSLAEVIFGNRLRHFLYAYAPEVDAGQLILAGASAAQIKATVPEEFLPAVRLAYSDTFDQVMYLAAGAGCGAFLFAFGMGWVRINTKSDK